MKNILRSVFLLALTATFLFANIGKIVAARGEVKITRDGQEVLGKTGTVILEEDVINTGPKAKMQVMFKDKTIVTIGNDSNFKVEEFVLGDEKTSKASFKFGGGAFRAITGQIGKLNPDKFKLKTKTATIGIRGTQILGRIRGGNDEIACTDGRIVVSPIGRPNTVVMLNAGQITQVPTTGDPTEPRSYEPQEINEIADSSGGGGEKMNTDDTIIGEGEGTGTEDTEGDGTEDGEGDGTEDGEGDGTGDGEGDGTEDGEGDGTEDGEGDGTGDGDGTVGGAGTGDTEGDGTVNTGGDGTEGTDNLAGAGDDDDEITLDDTSFTQEETPDNPYITQLVETTGDAADDAGETVENATETAESSLDTTTIIYENSALFPGDYEALGYSSVAFAESDPYLSWGVWATESMTETTLDPSKIVDGWVSGDITPDSVITQYGVDGRTFNYAGYVKGGYTDGTYQAMGSGTMGMTVSFGSANSVTGGLDYEVVNKNSQLENWSASIDSSNFTGNTFKTTLSGSGGSVAIDSGNIDGAFYGPGAQSVGGKFDMTSGTKKVDGIYIGGSGQGQ